MCLPSLCSCWSCLHKWGRIKRRIAFAAQCWHNKFIRHRKLCAHNNDHPSFGQRVPGRGRMLPCPTSLYLAMSPAPTTCLGVTPQSSLPIRVRASVQVVDMSAVVRQSGRTSGLEPRQSGSPTGGTPTWRQERNLSTGTGRERTIPGRRRSAPVLGPTPQDSPLRTKEVSQ